MVTKIDNYSLRARYLPVVISTLPLLLTISTLFPNNYIGIGILAGFITSAGITAILAQIGRDYGKNKEDKFNSIYGGKATTCLLRHQTSIINSNTLERYHIKLSKSLKTKKPTLKYENDHPAECDIIYESWIDWLKTKTRDKKKYSLIFEENVNYGFRRNLWGIKPFGIIFSIIALLASLINAIIHFQNNKSMLLYILIVIMINTLFIIFWIIIVSAKWVRLAANEYAKRLLESCENF